MLNFLIYGSGNKYSTLESLRDIKGRIFFQSSNNTDLNILDVTPDTVISTDKLLNMLTVVSYYNDPIFFLHTGDQVHGFELPNKLDKIIIPKDRDINHINLSGVIIPINGIRKYINMCNASGIYDGDEDTLFNYCKKLLGYQEYLCNMITTWDYNFYGDNNNRKLDDYLIRHPKDIIYPE